MNETVKIEAGGQVHIPQSVMEQLGLHAGSNVAVSTDGHVIIMAPVAAAAKKAGRKFEDLYGTLKHEGPSVTLDDMNDAIDTEMRKRWQHKSK